MDKIRLEIIGLSYSQSQSGAYALILGEMGGSRRLPIIIGGAEAQAIAVELERIKPTRPLTHDLFKSFAEIYRVTVREVIIDQFKQGVFHAKLICVHDNVETQIDSRTSDAVALAIRFKCPIYTYEKIIAETGIPVEEELKTTDPSPGPLDEGAESQFEEYTMGDLEDMLQKAVQNEDYEQASRIRDEITKRKKK